MAVKKNISEKLGVLTIGFSPVVREGLQSIMAKTIELKWLEMLRMEMKLFRTLNEHATGDRLLMSY